MTIYAGIDVGNATTEIVMVAHDSQGLHLLGQIQGLTRGPKGSVSSLHGAAAYLRRLERSLGVAVEEAFMAPLVPVTTTSGEVQLPEISTGRCIVVAHDRVTPGGVGYGVGRPLFLDAERDHGSPQARDAVVVIAPRSMRYQESAKRIRDLSTTGLDVQAVVIEGDEGVLVANRLETVMPVLDQIDVAQLRGATRLAVEVATRGGGLSHLSDPLALFSDLGLQESERKDASAVANQLLDASSALVMLSASTPEASPKAHAWIETPKTRMSFMDAIAALPHGQVGEITAFSLDGSTVTTCDDLFAVDLDGVARSAQVRVGSVSASSVVVSSLGSRSETQDHASQLGEILDIAVRVAATEAQAARRGALTTPGASQDALVVDLGAGTIDVMTNSMTVTAAGAGTLLGDAVARLLDISKASADWVKRGPSVRVLGPMLYETESGERGFTSDPAPTDCVGRLAIPGPAGLLGFDAPLTPSEWRALRLSAKERVFGANLERILPRDLGDMAQVIVVGGPAGDDELLGVLARCLPEGAIVARANCGLEFEAGTQRQVGHRYAAALGLVLCGIEGLEIS